MSVVNQMLKELDQKQGGKGQGADFVVAEIERKPLGLWLWLPLIALIIAAVYLLLPSIRQINPSTATDNTNAGNITTRTSSPSTKSDLVEPSLSVAQQAAETPEPLASAQKPTENKSNAQVQPDPKQSQKSYQNLGPVHKQAKLANITPVSSGTEQSQGLARAPLIKPVIEPAIEPVTAQSPPATKVNQGEKDQQRSKDQVSIAALDNKQLPQQEPSVKSLSIETQLSRALQQLKQESNTLSLSEIKERCQALLSRKQDFHPARLYLLQQLRHANDPEFYARAQLASQNWPNTTVYLQLLARAYIQDDNYREAARLLQNKSLSGTLLQLRALIWQKLGDHRKALADYQKLISGDPYNGSYLLALGISLKALGHVEQARQSFVRALQDRGLTATQKRYLQRQIQQPGKN